ncbi:MAG: hypothetical protein NC485_01800 [Ruminococcus flavefaciens]|nr:hypothetical protein [Ruminococcus flavefaciens]MCM1058726.1 hypothetical protein [Eubacterium sp.]
MKKIALLLAMLMSVSAFVSCGDNDDDDDNKKSSSYSSEDDSKKKDKDDSDEDEDETDPAEDETEPEEDETKPEEDETDPEEDETEPATEKTPTAAKDTDFERGTVDGDVYSSDYSGVQFTLPSGWAFMSEEDVLATMNIGFDVTGSDLTAELLDQLVIYDSVANNSLTGESIMFMYENISKTAPDPDSFTVEDYYEAAIKSASQMMSGVTLTGSDETEAVDIGGTEYLKYEMNISYDDYGFELTQTYFGRKIDNFIFIISYTSGIEGGSPDDYMSCFESID